MEIKEIRKFLKANIKNREFHGHAHERAQIFDLLQRTIQHGESNSALLIGPRSAGKTLMVEDILAELESKKSFLSNAILVKLQGLIHTDDRLALKSITTQLSLDNAVDGKVFGSFAENLAFLLACLRTGDKKTSKSIIFILDEFDLFCNHQNQTLLYNLFDVSQSAQAPVCVLGITCRLDVIELLEKRVKSRFSHRQIFLFLGQDENSEKSNLDYSLSRIQNYLKLPDDGNLKLNKSEIQHWNKALEKLLKEKKFKNCIQRIVDVDLSERTLKNILAGVIYELNEQNSKLSTDSFEKQINLLERDDIVNIIRDLTVLELCLIIAMKHHGDIYDNQMMNFEMIYTRYVKFANSNASIQTVERAVIMKAFEHIQNMELVAMVNSTNSRIQKEYQFFKLLVTPSQIQEAVKKFSGLPTEVIQWANSSLI